MIMKPPISTPACLTLIIMLAATFAPAITAAADAGNELYTRTFDVPPNFLTSTGAPARVGAKSILETSGIPFPQGASALFNAATSKLIARNTKANLDAIAIVVDKLLKKSPPNAAPSQLPKDVPVHIAVAVLAYDIARKDPLVAQAQDPKNDAKVTLQKLGTLATRGLVKVAALPAVATKSGSRAIAGNGDVALEIEPVISAVANQLSLTGTFKHGTSSLPINALISIGSIVFVGALDKVGSKDSVELVFIRASAQMAVNTR